MNPVIEFIGIAIKDFVEWAFMGDHNILEKFGSGMDKMVYFFTGGKK